MSQNPVLTEENTEEIKAAKPRRTRKAAATDGPAEEKKPVRRTRKKADAQEPSAEGETEEKKPRRRTTKKAAEAATDAGENENSGQQSTPRKTRTRRTPRKNTPEAEAPAEQSAQNTSEEENVIHLGSALVLDDMLPPSSVTSEDTNDSQSLAQNEAASAADKKRSERRSRAAVESRQPEAETAAGQPSDDDNIGNRADAADKTEEKQNEQAWFDDGIVTNILPYPG